jgi:1-acyl-sn-glycerol-3-phosphate acyltransferase
VTQRGVTQRGVTQRGVTQRPDPFADRSRVLLTLFGWYLRCWYVPRRFRALRISHAGLPQVSAGKSLVIYSNHASWWDPAMYILLGLGLLPERIGYGPMDAAELKRYGLLRRMGVFGIDTRTRRGAAEFLRIGRRILADPRGTLWVTAEGRFTDPRRRPVTLRPGIAHLARHVPDLVFMPLALEYSFWNETRPEALARFGAPMIFVDRRDPAEINAVLAAALADTMDALAAESMTRDPALFRPLLRGEAGVGGIYDLWRRLRSWASGRRFDAAHGQRSAQGGVD